MSELSAENVALIKRIAPVELLDSRDYWTITHARLNGLLNAARDEGRDESYREMSADSKDRT